LFNRAAKILELRTKALYFFQPRKENFWNLPTKATQIKCILLPHGENFGIVNKANQD
jgi:hypothetical protein